MYLVQKWIHDHPLLVQQKTGFHKLLSSLLYCKGPQFSTQLKKKKIKTDDCCQRLFINISEIDLHFNLKKRFWMLRYLFFWLQSQPDTKSQNRQKERESEPFYSTWYTYDDANGYIQANLRTITSFKPPMSSFQSFTFISLCYPFQLKKNHIFSSGSWRNCYCQPQHQILWTHCKTYYFLTTEMGNSKKWK